MYGYVVVNKDELKGKDFKRYRSFYCGLCQSLKKQYSFLGQVSVNYDMTFLAVLLSALYTPKTKIRKTHCIVHPLALQEYVSSEVLDYVADMNVLMTYFKCVDDWKDERKMFRYLYSKLLGSKCQKLTQQYREKVRRVYEAMRDFAAAENSEDVELDELAKHFGEVMSEVFVYRKDEWEPELRQVGLQLGKFVYILDAYDDYEKDIENGRFNPLVSIVERIGKDCLADWVHDVLQLMAADCARAFEILPIVEHADILRNILYSGIWTAYERKRV